MGAGALVSRSAGAAEDAERSADREAWPAAIATKPGEEAPVGARALSKYAMIPLCKAWYRERRDVRA